MTSRRNPRILCGAVRGRRQVEIGLDLVEQLVVAIDASEKTTTVGPVMRRGLLSDVSAESRGVMSVKPSVSESDVRVVTAAFCGRQEMMSVIAISVAARMAHNILSP